MKRGRDEEGESETEGLDMVSCVMLLHKPPSASACRSTPNSGFKCKTCNRTFSSFQALGGHRASHKKPRLMHSHPNKTHPCPICGVQFRIGQALGGHMRKHRSHTTTHVIGTPDNINTNTTRFQNLCLDLDLNLTPLENYHLNVNSRAPLIHVFIWE